VLGLTPPLAGAILALLAITLQAKPSTSGFRRIATAGWQVDGSNCFAGCKDSLQIHPCGGSLA